MITSNGDVIAFIKKTLAKELSLPSYDGIRHEMLFGIETVTKSWDELIANFQGAIYRKSENDCHSYFEQCIEMTSLIPPYTPQKDDLSTLSPIEALYLKVLQHEYIGNVLDIKKYISSAQPEEFCAINTELIAEMKALARNPVDLYDLNSYIDRNASRIDKYVYYTKPKPTKEDRRRMKEHIWKIPRIIEFCKRAKPLIDIRSLDNELFVVSCLQTILMDRESGKFEYTFYGHQREDANKIPNIPSIPRVSEPIVDVAQVYWERKVSNRWDANMGIYEARKSIRAFENKCDGILLEILKQPSIDGMIGMHNYYMSQIVAILNMELPRN